MTQLEVEELIKGHRHNRDVLIEDGFVIDRFSDDIAELILIAHHKDGRKVEIVV